MPYTNAPGFRMYYEVHGSGDALLLINGLGGDHVEWADQLPDFARHFRVIAFDNRGAGDSETPPGPYTIEGMADDAAALLTFLGVSRANVLGVSMGGMIAEEFALRRPGIVDRLVLTCTTPGGNLSVRPAPEAIAAFHRAQHGDREQELRGTIPFLYTDGFRRDRPGEIEVFVRRRLSRPSRVAGHAAQLMAAIGHRSGERLSGIRAKTLVITGEADILVPPENSRRIAERIPGAKLVVVAGAPHRLFAENAETFNRTVLDFLLARPENV